MTRKNEVKLKLVTTGAAGSMENHERDPRSLVRLDWYAAIILCALIVLAPLVAGDFATPSGVMPVDSNWSLFTAIGVPIFLIVAALAYLPFMWREWSKPVAIGDVAGLAPAFALLCAWAALSAIRTPALYLTVNALAVLCAAVVSAWIISRLARDNKALVAMLASVMAAGTIVAIIGIREYIEYLHLHVPQHRSFSTFSDPNFLAGYLLLTIPIALSLFACATDIRLRSFAGISVVVQSSALWLSGSRSGSGVILIAVGVFVGLALFVRTSAATARWLQIGLALFVIGSLPALTPLLSRLGHSAPARSGQTARGAGVASADPQVNSNEFRRWTWIGTAHMARANPVLGTGLGAFELSYPRYAETAFTVHAHNGYLQLMAETGYPGALIFIMGIAAAAAFAAHALLLHRKRASEPDLQDAGRRYSAAERFHPMVNTPELALAGLIAAITGSMLHSLIDSDWYVAANAFTFAAVIALAVALARDMAPLSTRRPMPLRKEVLAAGAVLALLILWRGGRLATSRMNESLGATEIDSASSNMASQDATGVRTSLARAAEEYRAAALADPLDPEPHLELAQISETLGDQVERLKELNAALAICHTGKAYYRLGQYYMSLREWAAACEAFEHDRDLQPKMPQGLHALASAYLAAGRPDDAERTLQTITALQRSPFGEVRAMHESVETEFAYAHSMLGEIYVSRGDYKDAALQYTQARDVLSEYWPGRNLLVYVGRSEAKRRELADLFETVLQQLQTVETRLDQPAEAQGAGAKLAAIRKDREADAVRASAESDGASSKQ